MSLIASGRAEPSPRRRIKIPPPLMRSHEAAIRASYSAKTAAEIGHENLIKPHVAAEIEKARAKRAERAEVTADWVVDELRKLASSNMADYMKSTPAGPALRSALAVGEFDRQHLAAAVPIDPDRDQHRLAGDHAGLAHPLVARVEDQIGKGFN